jgi:hypothetical protein
MKKLGIIQVGKIGDIIILLPIAKYYKEKGYEIIWPIYKNIIKNFLNYIDYVNFIPCEFDCEDARKICKDLKCYEILDLSIGLPNHNQENYDNLFSQTDISFDEFKYNLAKVPFDEKWNLKIKRNLENEKILYEKLIKNKKYFLHHLEGSVAKSKITLKSPENYDNIFITPITESIFDWIYTIEEASHVICLDSCIANLIEQLNLNDNKTFIRRSPKVETPVLRNNWRVL